MAYLETFLVTTPFWLLSSVEAGDAAEHFITPGQPHTATTGLVPMLRMLGLRKPAVGEIGLAQE